MKTFVLLTGLRQPSDVALVPESGAAGFILDVPECPSSLPLEDARSLIETVPSGAEAWAIVTAPTGDRIRRIYDELGVDRILVYGAVPEDVDFLERHHIVPVLPLAAVGQPGDDPRVPPSEEHSRLVFDTPGRPITTGSPERVDWERAAALVERHPGRKFVLAGGLHGENVAEALRTVRPWGLAVGAGVESSPGSKDPGKIREFLAAVERSEGPSA